MRRVDPQISFADLEFQKQGVKLDPVLPAIAYFIDAHDELVEAVRVRRSESRTEEADNGSKRTDPATVRGSMILICVKDWDYRDLRERIADEYILRIFTEFHAAPVPKHDAFNRWFNRLTPATVQTVNAAVIRGYRCRSGRWRQAASGYDRRGNGYLIRCSG